MNSPSEIAIRDFRFPEDYPACIEIWRTVGGGVKESPSDSIEEIEKKYNHDPDLMLVACNHQEIIATVIGGFDGRRGMIYHLAVKQEYQNQGIGRQLMTEIENRLVAKGCKKMYLMMHPDHTELLAYYKSLGWFPMNILVAAKEVGFR